MSPTRIGWMYLLVTLVIGYSGAAHIYFVLHEINQGAAQYFLIILGLVGFSYLHGRLEKVMGVPNRGFFSVISKVIITAIVIYTFVIWI
ncbi:hypothetical protein ACFO9Q_21720 [Paenibacillus sp. GCM10023252]|uniref:hypothetical protein n=1 Tax=Paenibacillus sp. GCM10023252 TaxID=3252649 RepID=UPI003623A3CE